MAAPESPEENMSSDRVYLVTDPESGLQCSLTVFRGGDGGASAVVVELRNPSDGHDVVLKVNTETSVFIMLTVTDQQGTVLSTPSKMFSSSEAQRFVFVRIARASSHRWRVPIAAQLPASKIPEEGMKGRLVVNIALLFSRVSGDEQPAEADFSSSLVTLYDMDVLFTQAALSEGEGPPTADPC
jgi:hypothetical protein